MLTHVDEKPYRCSACDFTARRPDKVRTHQRKRHPEGTDLTVVSVDVKLPDGAEDSQVNVSQLATALTLHYSGHIKELHDLHTKARKDSSPTMVPPNFYKPPALVLPSSNNTGAILTEEYPQGTKLGSGSGPVFPGQISPRITHFAAVAHSQSDLDISGPKRIKLENGASKRFAHQQSMKSAISQSNNSSSRRKAQPIKLEPESPIPSFEGFGTTDFSSIGIPEYCLQNPANPVLSGAPQNRTLDGNHVTSPGYGQVRTFGTIVSGVHVKKETATPTLSSSLSSSSSSSCTTSQFASSEQVVTKAAVFDSSCNTSGFQLTPVAVPLALYRNTCNNSYPCEPVHPKFDH